MVATQGCFTDYILR